MASSLNGLTVGDSLPENLMESPARSEGTFYTRLVVALKLNQLSIFANLSFLMGFFMS